jgi:hypothetical protein
LSQIGLLEKGKKRLRPFGDRSVELGWAFVFNQSAMGGGVLAAGRWQRAAKRLQKLPRLPNIAPKLKGQDLLTTDRH